MNNLSKKLIGWLLKAGISAGILWYILLNIPFSNILTLLKTADLRWFLLAFLCALSFSYCHALRMKIFTANQGMSLSVMQIFNIGLSSNFYSLFLPGGSLSGGPIRWYKLSQVDNMPAQALVSMVYNRIVHITTITGVGFLFWILDPSLKKDNSAGWLLAAAAIILVAFHFLALGKHTSSFLETWLHRISFIPQWIREKIKKILNSARQTQNLSPKSWFSIWVFSALGDAFGICSFYLLALALGVELNLIHWGWIRSSVVLLTLLPISIAGLGIREGAFVILLGPFGIEPTSAVAYSFILFIQILVLAGLGGLIEAKTSLFPNHSKPRTDEAAPTT